VFDRYALSLELKRHSCVKDKTPTWKMDLSDLIVGNTYCLNILLPFHDIPNDHPFISHRHMRFEGIDTEWKYGTSYIFSDEIDLYQSIRNDKDSYDVFVKMTHVCQSRIQDGRWYIHICQERPNGALLIAVT